MNHLPIKYSTVFSVMLRTNPFVWLLNHAPTNEIFPIVKQSKSKIDVFQSAGG